MKKFILSAIAILMVFGLQAQNGNGKMRREMNPEKMAQFETQRMTKQLNLDEATQAKVQEINLKYATKQQAKMKEKREQNKSDREANREKMRKEMQEMQAQKDAEFKKVLSAKDFATYQKQQKKMRKNMKQHRQQKNNANSSFEK